MWNKDLQIEILEEFVESQKLGDCGEYHAIMDSGGGWHQENCHGSDYGQANFRRKQERIAARKLVVKPEKLCFCGAKVNDGNRRGANGMCVKHYRKARYAEDLEYRAKVKARANARNAACRGKISEKTS